MGSMGTILIIMIHVNSHGWRPESAIALPNLKACEAIRDKYYPYKPMDKVNKRAMCVPQTKPPKD